MPADFAEILLLAVRGALFAGLCWGAWLCFAEQAAPEKSAKKPPLERFATFAVLVLLLTAFGGMVHV
jgi:hypothetical protein